MVKGSNVTIEDTRIQVTGDVHLILMDGATLNAPKGIQVVDGNALTIYGQRGQTGALTVNDVTEENAGIGGNSGQACGYINIYGGEIATTGGAAGAGIGNGSGGCGSGTIHIRGDQVTATGRAGGAAIGSGGGDAGSLNISIKGGIVNATAIGGGAAIGGGIGGNNESSRFYINGGKVRANDGDGGGVYVKGGSFTMSGGVIGGTDSADANNAYFGGGVYVKGGSAAMSGGAIRGNTAKDSGGGVYVKGGAFKVSGAPTVTGNVANGADDNVCLPENMTITVADALTEGASFGVYVGVNGKGRDITTDYAKHNGGDEPSKYFTSDEEDYVVGWNDGFDEAVVGKAINCGAAGYEGDYDGMAHDALSVGVTEPASGATVTYSADGVTFGRAAPTVTDAGDHTAYYRVTASGYAGVRGTVAAKIAPIDATVTITGKTNTAPYDGKAHKVSGYDFKASTPLYTEGDFTCSGAAEAAQTGAGTAAMGLKADQFANRNKNFKRVVFNVTDGWQKVEPAALAVTADAKSKTYGEADPALTYTVDGLLDGDSLTGELTREPGENAGTYEIMQGTLKATDNYALTFTGAKLTIGRAEVTVAAVNKSKTYGNKNPKLTAKVSGLKNGDAAGVISYTLTRAKGKNVGSYAIKAKGEAVQGNYTVTFKGAKLKIKPRPLTVTAKAKTKAQGAADPKLTYTVKGLVKGDKLTGKLSRKPGEAPGRYAITRGTLKASKNYRMIFRGPC